MPTDANTKPTAEKSPATKPAVKTPAVKKAAVKKSAAKTTAASKNAANKAAPGAASAAPDPSGQGEGTTVNLPAFTLAAKTVTSLQETLMRNLATVASDPSALLMYSRLLDRLNRQLHAAAPDMGTGLDELFVREGDAALTAGELLAGYTTAAEWAGWVYSLVRQAMEARQGAAQGPDTATPTPPPSANGQVVALSSAQSAGGYL